MKTGEPDRHDYAIKIVNGSEVAPGPNWHSLYRWVISQAAEFLAFQTVYLVTDNRDLLADTVANTPGVLTGLWWLRGGKSESGMLAPMVSAPR